MASKFTPVAIVTTLNLLVDESHTQKSPVIQKVLLQLLISLWITSQRPVWVGGFSDQNNWTTTAIVG